jgi:hypothetical protein
MLFLSQNSTLKEKFTGHIHKNGSKKPLEVAQNNLKAGKIKI